MGQWATSRLRSMIGRPRRHRAVARLSSRLLRLLSSPVRQHAGTNDSDSGDSDDSGEEIEEGEGASEEGELAQMCADGADGAVVQEVAA